MVYADPDGPGDVIAIVGFVVSGAVFDTVTATFAATAVFPTASRARADRV